MFLLHFVDYLVPSTELPFETVSLHLKVYKYHKLKITKLGVLYFSSLFHF